MELGRTMIKAKKPVGAAGYLAIFFCSLTAIIVAPIRLLPLTAAVCLLTAAAAYPQAFRGLFRWRWLAMIVLLAVPPVFLIGEIDRSLYGIGYSSEGVNSSIQILLRILVVLVSVNGLTSTVDISSLAGLMEKLGLRGLGFSFGVAVNLLPALRQSAQTAWRSLWMRGGLRKQRWRGLRLLAVTIFANALGRAEEIALAAETRAYSPERSRSLPVKAGRWDGWILAGGLLAVLALSRG